MGDKKARGEAGKRNAESHPFRMNGWSPDWQAQRQRVYNNLRAASSGSTTMRGLLGGVLAAKLGYAFPIGQHYDRMMVHAQGRCTHRLFADDGDQNSEPQREAA